ncbi:MAG: terminase family protein [Verrucomicrobiota bacterium JB024]|nr:terminase family protein [Verrucomicrobiota bacterium JB024]
MTAHAPTAMNASPVTTSAAQLAQTTAQPLPFFLPYQRKWIEDTSRLKIMEKSRQIGLSWTSAYSLVREQSRSDARLDAWVSSRDEMQARLFLEDAKSFASILHRAAGDLGATVVSEGGGSAFALEFANGRRLHCLSSNADAQAGKRGTRLLDEFALHPDPRHLYAIAYPGITWGGQLEIVSTHRGSNNFFNQLIREVTEQGNPKGFSHHRVTLQDALDQGFLTKLKEKLPPEDPRAHMDEAAYYDFIRASCADEESFQQEYLCRPADDTTAFLSWELISECEYAARDEWEIPLAACAAGDAEKQGRDLRLAHDLYLGVDIGREHDLSVFWLVERINDLSLTRNVTTLERTPFAQQEEVLDAFLSLPTLRRACIDQSGLGRQFAERAAARYGGYRVEGVTFTAGLKEALAYPVRSAFENRTLRIPPDKRIRADLRAVKKEATASGNVRFCAERGANGHADRFWALALALHAGRQPAARATHYESLNLPARGR